MLLVLMIMGRIMCRVIIHPEVEAAGPLILERTQVQRLLGLWSHGHQDINTLLCFMDWHLKNLGTEWTSVTGKGSAWLKKEGSRMMENGVKRNGEKLRWQNISSMGEAGDIQEKGVSWDSHGGLGIKPWHTHACTEQFLCDRIEGKTVRNTYQHDAHIFQTIAQENKN